MSKKKTFDIPQHFIDHLDEGKKLIFIATPFDTTKETITCAFDKRHIYDSKLLPTGISWVRDAPSGDLPGERTAEQIIETFLEVITKMSYSVGGAAIHLFIPAETKSSLN
jgi:hypothetical protein